MSIKNEEKENIDSEVEEKDDIINEEEEENEDEEDDSNDKSNTSEDDDSEDDSDEDDKEEDNNGDKVTISKEEYNILRTKNRIKEKKEKSGDSNSNSDELTIARLEARGVLHPDDQKKVIKLAKILGIGAIEALSDPDVKFALEKDKKARLLNKATKINSKGGGSNNNSQDVKWYIEKGIVPSHKKDPKLYEAYEAELVRRAKNSA